MKSPDYYQRNTYETNIHSWSLFCLASVAIANVIDNVKLIELTALFHSTNNVGFYLTTIKVKMNIALMIDY